MYDIEDHTYSATVCIVAPFCQTMVAVGIVGLLHLSMLFQDYACSSRVGSTDSFQESQGIHEVTNLGLLCAESSRTNMLPTFFSRRDHDHDAIGVQ